MGSASNLGAVVAWGGFIFGAVANRTNFCAMGAVSDVVSMGSWGRMRMWLLAIAIAILGTHALQLAGQIDLSKWTSCWALCLRDRVAQLSRPSRGSAATMKWQYSRNDARMRGAGALSIEASIGPML